MTRALLAACVTACAAGYRPRPNNPTIVPVYGLHSGLVRCGKTYGFAGGLADETASDPETQAVARSADRRGSVANMLMLGALPFLAGALVLDDSGDARPTGSRLALALGLDVVALGLLVGSTAERRLGERDRLDAINMYNDHVITRHATCDDAKR